MMSLFNSFDMYFFLSAKISLTIILFYLQFIFLKNLTMKSLKFLSLYMHTFLLSIKNFTFPKFDFLIFIPTFLMVLTANSFSVLGYNFPLTSQVSLVLFMGLLFWVSINLVSLFSNMKGFLSHMVPEGTPLYLVWLLFMIEMTSNLIRPVTLVVRLVANIVAGHLLMVLLSQIVMKFFLLSMFYLILNLIEFFVALIQSYIFVTMITLYHSESF